MYRAYKIEVDSPLKVLLKQSPQGQSLEKIVENVVHKSLTDWSRKTSIDSMKEKLLKMATQVSLSAEELNADSIWDEWFPEIEADVFISHSSKDASVARLLSDWLWEHHQLKAFIDSEIWGHSDELLKKLDNEYCLNHEGETYSYEKRNGSTAHVHMMLSYALTRMIDRAECFIFLESHNSVSAEEAVKGTYSPWIFHELATVDTIKRKQPSRLIEKSASQRDAVSTESFNLKIKYPLMGKRLRKVDHSALSAWTSCAQRSQSHSLDILYEGTPSQIGEL